MNSLASVLFILLLIFSCKQQSSAQQPIRPRQHITIERSTDSSITGTVMRVDIDSINVRNDSEMVSVAVSSIDKMSVVPESTGSQWMVNGLLLGHWSAMMWLSTPSYSVNNAPFLYAIPIALVPGLAGWLIDLATVSSNDLRFSINRLTTSADSNAFRSFREYMSKTPHDRSWRLTVNEAFQFPGLSERLKQRYPSGYAPSYPWSVSIYPGILGSDACLICGAEGDLNILRNIQLSFAITSGVDIGVSYSLFNNMPLTQFQLDTSSQDITFLNRVSHSPKAQGGFITGSYRLPLDHSGTIELLAGGGIGVVSMTCEIEYQQFKVRYDVVSELPLSTKTTFTSSIQPASIGFLRLQGYPDRMVMLGISLDLIVTGNLSLAADPEIGLAGESINFSSGSIGFLFGWSF